MTRRWVAVCAGVVLWGLASLATAQTTTSTTTSTSTSSTVQVTGGKGTILSAATTTGAGTTQAVITGSTPRVTFETVISAGTATVAIEQKLFADSAFYTVGTPRTTSGLTMLDYPHGVYRANVTDCAGCTVTVRYYWK